MPRAGRTSPSPPPLSGPPPPPSPLSAPKFLRNIRFMTDFGTRSQVAIGVFLVMCMCVYFFFSALLLLDHSIRLADSTSARECAWKRGSDGGGGARQSQEDTRVFSVFFLNPFLNLVKRFYVRLCDFSESFLLSFSLFLSFRTSLGTLISV